MSDGDDDLGRLTKQELIALIRSKEGAREVRSDSEFRALVDDSVLGVVVHRHGNALYANQAFATLLGFSTPEEVLATESILSFFVPENRARVRDLHERRLSGEDMPRVFEHPLIRQDGTEVWIESRISDAIWEGEPAVHVAVVDASEKRRVEQMKDDFVSTVSHELRTPLTSISGALGLIASGMAGAVPAKQRELIEIAANNSERLVRLVNDILDAQSFDSGDFSLEVAPVNADAVVEETLVVNRPFLERLNVRANFARRTDGTVVIGARDAIVQVLTNLLSNAAKFAGENDIELSARVDDGWVEFVVSDRGPGVDEDLVPNLFSRFARGRAVGGTGLGLYISRNLVEAQGGSIAYRPGSPGSRFVVRLPLAPE